MRLPLGVLLMLVSLAAQAHPLAPALLQLREVAAAQYDVTWRTSVTSVRGAEIAPVLPPDCVVDVPAGTFDGDDAFVVRWTAQCAPLAGSRIAIEGLQGAGINVILRIEPLQGAPLQALLDATQPQFVVPLPQVVPAAFPQYLRLGVEHLLGGLDHVLFVAGLVLLVRGARRLILTVTAFTLGHSLTLALATLGWVRVNPALMELGIALSILVLALELTRPRDAAPSILARYPALMALGFGLLHGMGFAGALAQVGLPGDDVPLALLAFNVGIEAGQLILVAAMLAAAGLLRAAPATEGALRTRAVRLASAYVLGALSVRWCLERAVALVA